jgi:ubiquinone/menaquinone biosynthesis C-methylase UbiE
VDKDPDSNTEWRSWGKVDPLYGVATTPGKQRDGASPWSDDEFPALGRRDWQGILPAWQRYGLDTSSFEIGCGAGRMTKQLAETFGTVHALDVSEHMIAYAREHVQLANVSFELVNGTELPYADASVGAAFSTHVFQHFDSVAHAVAYFAEIARVLLPGSTMMIHLPVHRWPTIPQFFERLYRLKKRGGDARAWARRQLIRLGVERPIMRYLSYDMNELLPMPESSVHPFLFARRKRT